MQMNRALMAAGGPEGMPMAADVVAVNNPMQQQAPPPPMPQEGMQPAQMQGQTAIPPPPPGVIPGTDEYFAWVESTGLAQTPEQFQQIFQYHQGMETTR